MGSKIMAGKPFAKEWEPKLSDKRR